MWTALDWIWFRIWQCLSNSHPPLFSRFLSLEFAQQCEIKRKYIYFRKDFQALFLWIFGSKDYACPVSGPTKPCLTTNPQLWWGLYLLKAASRHLSACATLKSTGDLCQNGGRIAHQAHTAFLSLTWSQTTAHLSDQGKAMSCHSQSTYQTWENEVKQLRPDAQVE